MVKPDTKIVKENKESFSKKVMQLVWQKDISYLEALSEVAEQLEYEPQHVAKLITEDLKALIAFDAEKLSLIKKSDSNRLD